MNQMVTRDRDQILAELLCTLRNEAKLRQIDLAEKLGKPQSFVSKYESGERRLDILELSDICTALTISLSEVVLRLETELK
jgi:transcriptional regulator with XRE-family HTH domain